jgi:flagellar motor protein MotB
MIQARFSSIRLAWLAGMAALLSSCATFKGEIPVAAAAPERTYISPRNADGIQDRLMVPVAVSAPYTGMAVGGYRFDVADATGAGVWSAEEAAVPQGTLVRQRVSGVSVPANLSWDGKDAAGAYVGDGEYTWGVVVWDTKGNTGSSPRYTVVVDNTPPSVSLATTFDLFSPDGDGNLDQLAIEHGGASTEDEWRGEFRNDVGRAVRSEVWTGTPPATLTWDGTDAEGRRAPDGAYVYSVSSRDRAGNSTTVTTGRITVDTSPASIALGLTSRQFSPNGDGVRDTVQFLPRAANPETVTNWSIVVQNAGRGPLRRFSGEGRVPERLEFDGRDDRGAVLPEGVYTGLLALGYRNGATPETESPTLIVKTTPPRAAVLPDFLVFSPDGDGNRDTVTIRQDTSQEESWQGHFSDSRGSVVATRSWEDVASSFAWDGRDDAGALLPDGSYTYTLESTDAAGNRTVERVQNLRLDTRPASVFLTSSAAVFSPNADGVRDTVDFDLVARPADGIDQWRLRIFDIRGIRVADFIGQPGVALPTRVSWDGRLAAGGVAEGRLTAELVVQYERGNVARAERQVVSDLNPPRLTAAATPALFSPDDDGVDDTLSIRLEAADESGIGPWSAHVLDPGGQIFMQWSGTGAPRSTVSWNGRSATGELVQSAEDYALVFRAEDTVGNGTAVSTTVPIDILVIRDGDRLKIVISSIYFKEFTPDFVDVPADRARDNLLTLDRLAEKLLKFPQYNIRVEGHAVSVYWNIPARARTEEQAVLQPLSRARAVAVRDALVQRGAPAPRMTVAGFGGTQPVVPHGDLQNRWKNRRVEFVLSRR